MKEEFRDYFQKILQEAAEQITNDLKKSIKEEIQKTKQSVLYRSDIASMINRDPESKAVKILINEPDFPASFNPPWAPSREAWRRSDVEAYFERLKVKSARERAMVRNRLS